VDGKAVEHEDDRHYCPFTWTVYLIAGMRGRLAYGPAGPCDTHEPSQ